MFYDAITTYLESARSTFKRLKDDADIAQSDYQDLITKINGKH